MYRYTPSKQILHGLRKIRRERYVRDKEYHFINQFVPDYTSYTAFYRWFDGFVFYSPTRLKEVPLHGILMSVSLFEEEKMLQPAETGAQSPQTSV